MPENNTFCIVCGKGFYTSPGHKKNGWGKYCSISCRSVSFSGNGNPRSKSNPDTICDNCGKLFHRKLSYGIKHRTHFCSMRCKKIKRGKRKVICSQCGKVFEKYQAYIKGKKHHFCSRECAYMYNGKNRQMWGEGSRGGKREDLDNQYFRSSWEANYARYLNWLITQGEIDSWQFEPDTFEFEGIKRGCRFYTPDFKIFDKFGNFEYHEIKGYMDQKSQTRLKRMSKYYPKVKLVLIGKEEYQAISKQLRHIVPGWEVAEKHTW